MGTRPGRLGSRWVTCLRWPSSGMAPARPGGCAWQSPQAWEHEERALGPCAVSSGPGGPQPGRASGRGGVAGLPQQAEQKTLCGKAVGPAGSEVEGPCVREGGGSWGRVTHNSKPGVGTLGPAGQGTGACRPRGWAWRRSPSSFHELSRAGPRFPT